MAIVRIDFSAQPSPGHAQEVAAVVNATMHEVLGVPMQENFVICQGHAPGMVLHNPQQVSPEQLAQTVFIQITLNQGRAPELKERFFQVLTDRLTSQAGLEPQYVYLNLVEVARENWSFGQGTKTY